MNDVIQNNLAPPMLLQVEDLQTWFPIRRGILSRTVGFVKAVNSISFDMCVGETLGLVGESGCGKTTLGRTIIGLEKPYSGRIVFAGHEITNSWLVGDLGLHRKMQMIFQDPYSSLNPRMTVMDIVTEGLLEHKIITASERESVALQLLAEVGLDARSLLRFPHEFSGGQRQRISIARALSLKPDFIICDEAVSALDVSVQAQVINLLMDLQERYRLTYLFISHDLHVVRHIANQVAVMYLGHIVERGPTAAVMENPLHPYTQGLIAAAPKPGQPRKSRPPLLGEIPSPANPPAGCPFHPRCSRAMAICKTLFPPVIHQEKQQVRCHLYTE